MAITGGEPLIQKDIRAFILKVRALGYPVKLDTNGTRPELLKELVSEGLVDYVAVDIKNSKERYAETAGMPALDLSPIEETVSFLLRGTVPYEFRTTVVREYHTIEDIGKIGQWIRGADRYFLQKFVDSGSLIGENMSEVSKSEMIAMQKEAEKYVKSVAIRGVD